MSYPLRQPRFVLSSKAKSLVRIDALDDIVTSSFFDGIDLDLTVNGLRQRLSGIDRRVGSLQVSSAWLRCGSPHAADLELAGILDTGSVLFIVDEPRNLESAVRAQLAMAKTLRSELSERARIALAIRPRNAEGDRGHLTRLAMLRSVAEEWELELALDLTGDVDWLWEAEAAVAKTMPKLSFVRINYPPPLLDQHVRNRLTQRTISACIDLQFDGVISLAPPVPFWLWTSRRALEERALAAQERLQHRFLRANAADVWDTPQPSRHTL
jgi:hypothetical protein